MGEWAFIESLCPRAPAMCGHTEAEGRLEAKIISKLPTALSEKLNLWGMLKKKKKKRQHLNHVILGC